MCSSRSRQREGEKKARCEAGLKKKRLSLPLTYVFFFFAFFFFGIRLFSSLGRVGAHHWCPNAMSTSYVRGAPRIVKQNIEHDGTGAALDAGLEPFAPLGARVIPGPFPRGLPDYDVSASSETVG